MQQEVVALPPTAKAGVEQGAFAAADQGGGFAQLLNDLGTTGPTSAAVQPGGAGQQIFPGMIPVDGVDDGLGGVLQVPDGAAKGVAGGICGDGQAVEWRRGRGSERLVWLRVL